MFTKNQVKNLLIDAFEGGSVYWFNDENFVADVDSENYPFNTKIETPDGQIIDLDSKINNGYELMVSKYPHIVDSINADAYDAADADVFFQMCLFGELIYG